jgi:hypothetical protein
MDEQVTGSLTKPLEDPNALFRFHEDEKEGPLLNCRSIWFQNAREPLLVVSELLYTMLNLRLKIPDKVCFCPCLCPSSASRALVCVCVEAGTLVFLL